MPQRIYAVTINVTRTFVVDTDTELCLQGYDVERGSAADWEKLYEAVRRGDAQFIDDVLENVVAVEVDQDAELQRAIDEHDGFGPPETDKSDDPLE